MHIVITNELHFNVLLAFIFLMNTQSPQKWWHTVNRAVFGLSSSWPLLVGGGVRWCASRLVRLHDLLSDHLDGKHSMESVDHLCLTPHTSLSLSLLSGRVRSDVSC